MIFDVEIYNRKDQDDPIGGLMGAYKSVDVACSGKSAVISRGGVQIADPETHDDYPIEINSGSIEIEVVYWHLRDSTGDCVFHKWVLYSPGKLTEEKPLPRKFLAIPPIAIDAGDLMDYTDGPASDATSWRHVWDSIPIHKDFGFFARLKAWLKERW